MVNGQAGERAPVLTMPVQEHLLAFDGDGIGHQAATGTQGLPAGSQQSLCGQAAAKAAAASPDEPPGTRVRSQGLLVVT